MSRRRWVIGAIAGIAVLLLAGRLIAGWSVEYRWYEALGAGPLFWVRAGNLLMLRGGAFVVGTLLVFVNLYTVRHSVVSVVFPRRVGNIEIGEEVPGRYLLAAVLVLSVGIGLLLALPHRDWMSLDLVRSGEPFREADPYFQHDLAFWTYWLPLESALHLWSLIAVLATSLIVVFLYALTPSLRWENGRLRVYAYTRRHLFVLGGICMLLLAWSYRLDAYRLLLQGGGSGGAFLALDHRLGIPANLLLAMATIVGAMLLVWSGWAGQLRLALVTLGAVLVLSLSLRHLVPPIAIRFLTPTDVEVRDRPYVATRAAFTRRAFDTDAVVTVGTNEPLPNRAAFVRGIPLWDPSALRRAVAFQRTNGRFTGAMGWEQREGRPSALLVEAPIGPDAADAMAPWSVARFEADMAGEDGSLVRDRGATEDTDRVPAALVSDSATGYAIVFDSLGTVAAPALETFASRLLHAWGLQNPRLLQQDERAPPARVVQYRDVRERVTRLYPYFTPGNRSWPIVVGDSLLWVMHLYSSSEFYPLSEPVVTPRNDGRYFRHAAVTVTNAHTGRVVAIASANPDPMALSWFRRLPSMFVPVAAVSEPLLRQLPPPNEMALTQARVLARFGRRGESVPPSHIARPHGGDTVFAFPSATPYVDPETDRLGFAFPILDATERLRGVFSATGGADYEARWLPLDALGPRWSTILERLRRALDSATTTRGSAALTRGPVRAVASGRRFAFVQTAYEWRQEAAPAARAAALLVGDSLRVGRTVMAAAGIAEPAVPAVRLTPEAFRARVSALYAEMRDALARGDWVGFGVAYESLGKLLRAAQTSP